MRIGHDCISRCTTPRAGLWHPEFGELVQPDGWDYLPAGDAFVTRRVVQWLDFSPTHAALASEIAHGAVDRAAKIGSGGVGRTKT